MVLALAAGVTSGALPAHAAMIDGEVYVEYSARFDNYSINEDDSRDELDDFDGTIGLSCTVDGCVVLWAGAEGAQNRAESERFAIPGSTSIPIPALDGCDEPIPGGPGALSLAFTATEVTGSRRTEPLVGDCEGDGNLGLRAYGWEWTILSSSLTMGACYFTAEGCPELGAGPEEAGAEESSAEAGTDAETGDARPAASASRLGSGSLAAPSVLSGLATPAEAGVAPTQLALAIALTIVLVILVAFPTSLLNSAVEAGSDRVGAWRLARSARREQPRGRGGTSTPTKTWWWAATGVLLAGVISAFVDPEFGVNPGSLRVVLSILVSFAIDVVLGWALVVWAVRRAVPDATPSFDFRPASLIIVVLAVVFTRLTGFEPGIIFGLVAGVAFAVGAGKARQAAMVLTTLGYAFAVALLAWILYGLLGGGADGSESAWQVFVLETLSAIAVGGMAALPVALIPLRGMAGHAVWAWRRGVWAAAYAVGLFAFFIVLMPMPFSWGGVSLDLWAWIGMYLLYAVVAVVAWLVVTRPWRRDEEPADDSTAVPETGRPGR